MLLSIDHHDIFLICISLHLLTQQSQCISKNFLKKYYNRIILNKMTHNFANELYTL